MEEGYIQVKSGPLDSCWISTALAIDAISANKDSMSNAARPALVPRGILRLQMIVSGRTVKTKSHKLLMPAWQ